MGSLGDETAAMKKAMWLYPKVLGFNPSERWGHSACYSHGAVYVFGGCCGGLHFNDVLMLNLDTMVWSTLATTGQGPGPRDSHSAVLVGNQMVVFGGTNGYKKVNDLHILDLGTKGWISPECKGTPPSPRESHTATLVDGDKIMIFGGSGEGEGNYLNDLHILELKAMRWSSPKVDGDIPVPRDSHGAVAIGHKFYVYGGDRGDRYHGDVDVLDMDTLVWTKLVFQGPSPGVRAGHATVNIGTKVYVIGGVGDKNYYNDIWVLDMSKCSWTQLEICGQQPQGRFSHTAVAAYSDIVIYGGCGEDERPLNELLVLQLGAEHPNGRYNMSTCKIFGSYCNQVKRKFPQEAEDNSGTMLLRNGDMVRKRAHEPELEPKQRFQLTSDTPHTKRKTTASSKAWEAESEQEEHSLSLSQHSSPSQSDQEQNPVKKTADSLPASQEFSLFKQLNQIPRNGQPIDITSNQNDPRNMAQRTPYELQILREQKRPEQVPIGRRRGTPFPVVEQRPVGAVSIHNLIGADVRGKVDGAFDSGFLMTATVNGKIFRGVLFAPAPEIVSRVSVVAPSPSPSTQMSNLKHIGSMKPYGQPTEYPTAPEPDKSSRHFKAITRPCPVLRAAPSLAKEPKLRSDLQGVVLTLGGPGGGHVGQT